MIILKLDRNIDCILVQALSDFFIKQFTDENRDKIYTIWLSRSSIKSHFCDPICGRASASKINDMPIWQFLNVQMRHSAVGVGFAVQCSDKIKSKHIYGSVVAIEVEAI